MSTNVLLSKELVRQKCKDILHDAKNLSDLLREKSYESFVTDDIACTLAERYLERIVTRAIDVNFHLIRSLGAPPPDDYTQSFLRLATLKVMPATLAKNIAPSAGARNVLVHQYDDLNTKRFYSSLRDCVRLFPRYVRAIESYIAKH